MDDYGRLALAVAVVAAVAGTSGGAAAWGWQQQQPPLAPCMYVFGDSLVDNGNNNDILSLARANYRPYGIDFHEGPPGRFTNGRTMVDFLSDMLRLRPPLLPPYATARPEDLPRGVNFASGASGILPETGNNLGGHYPLSEQVDHFRAAVSDMGNTSEFRGNATKVAAHLGRCIFFVGMGSNDYLNNYFMPDYYDTARRYSPRDYAALLLQGYSDQLTQLYGLGARKFVVAGVGLIGCIPYELARMDDDHGPSSRPSNQSAVSSQDIAISIGIGGGGGGGGIGIGGGRVGGRLPSTMPLPYTDGDGGNGNGNGNGNTNPAPNNGGGCNETINSAIDIYNRGLLAMVKRFNSRGGLRGAKFVFLDAVQSGKDLVANAAAHGFTVLDRGCCGVGRNNGQITCLPLQRPCDDRSKYMFWDAFHPTEAVHRIYAAKAFSSNSTAEVYPINVSQLAAI
ncbi:hypothetical protein BDA96_03G115100 [Sorghum bicolor]|uniref:GDSL esterase/lipase n=2 Tax=Sorghum bicolor TaxID=4558 RepID=A0A921ULX9_SORBI|nr:GDSL esterase/lipase At1g33811 [Sorghum bicolor]KAG0537057.1 hypothetical protein BDA96_03G115100 [Sorghum bicolor]KXG32163.1 hypothetical protein SORBI_3003G110600 [Sorghum bicolor]|eukprot:XP_021312569.1 GDSL esterase/lipase At1g33811 [Sorghum bicolor]